MEYATLDPAIRAFLLIVEGEKKKTLRKSCQDFEVTEARTSGRVNLVFSRQIGFPKVNTHLLC